MVNIYNTETLIHAESICLLFLRRFIDNQQSFLCC